jgi:response regulator RpfG family c-di-GMP phosphodiesterase
MKMGPVLFVHQDPGFRDRIQSEAAELSHSNVVVHESLRGSLATLSDPSVPLSAVYVSVQGLDLSLLQVIEQLLVIRPVTPLFLLDHEMNPGIRKLAVQDAFPSHLALEDFLTPLKGPGFTQPLSIPGPPSRRPRGPEKEIDGFLAAPVCDFLSLIHYPCDVFVHPGGGSILRIGTRGDAVDTALLSRLQERMSFLYLRSDEIFEKRTALQDAQKNYLRSDAISPEWKTSEILVEARKTIMGIRGDSLNDLNIDRSVFFLERLFTHLERLSDRPDSDDLKNFLRQAGSNDRALSTLAIAILYCSKMKFHRSTVIEILGLAALLQDVSLYQSPFGDLSVKDPDLFTFEEKVYHTNHPIISADLVATNTSLPEVVAQVIRQHHERKDRTGFPNRTGGAQLHPVAEALSLLNLYLESMHFRAGITSLSEREFAQKLITEVLPHYSKSVTGPFLKVIVEFPFTKRGKSV